MWAVLAPWHHLRFLLPARTCPGCAVHVSPRSPPPRSHLVFPVGQLSNKQPSLAASLLRL